MSLWWSRSCTCGTAQHLAPCWALMDSIWGDYALVGGARALAWLESCYHHLWSMTSNKFLNLFEHSHIHWSNEDVRMLILYFYDCWELEKIQSERLVYMSSKWVTDATISNCEHTTKTFICDLEVYYSIRRGSGR